MRKLVLTTFGSLGDLHPYLALGEALQARGFRVTLATAALYRQKVEAHGLTFHQLGPEHLSPEDPELMRLAFNPRSGLEALHRRIVFPHLKQGYEHLLGACVDADAIISGSLTYTAPLLAARLGIPWVSTLLQPSALLSAHDLLVPPFFPGLRRLKFVGPRLRGLMIAGFKADARRWQAPLHELRRSLGLPPDKRPFTDWLVSPELNLALFSPHFAAPQPDWPASTRATGFIFSDRRQPGDRAGDALHDFLARGAPPLVFTLGSAAVFIAGDFYRVAARVAARLGCRALLLAGKGAEALRAETLPGDVFVQDYAPYSEVLPQALAVIHQCGVGTSAQTLRSGRPSLAVPVGVDQFDNAARLERFGVAEFLPFGRFNEARATTALRRLLAAPGVDARAATLASAIQQEDGLKSACDALSSFLN